MRSEPGPGSARAAILGTGLLGGSLAAALKQRRLARTVIGFSPGDSGDRALSLGLIDARAESPAAAVAGADLVVLAAPVSENARLIATIRGHLAPGALLTDVSSVKRPVIDAARRVLGDRLADFVASHPIAGSDRSGPQAADPALFDGRLVVVTPLAESSPAQQTRLLSLWHALGATTRLLDADVHDRLYALVSHWPHAVAFAMADTVAADPAPGGPWAGKGLLDLTRIAASSPELWADILLQNAEPVLAVARRFRERTERIENALRDGDRDALRALFASAADWRRGEG